ncbi:hypothetical protein SLS58_006247 [Diplodia intermedia]|uniref:FAD dependent oxidoreductase domain-containing protein n=1 Tax=Diplodia intermedia TaxID=856260 RepID=A0ABR3TNX9_9PEZI
MASEASLRPTATTVVIGSGITACSLVNALLQKDPDADIVVCEARGLTSGATGRNGGHLVSSAVADFSALQADFGTAVAVEVAAFTLANVERMFEVVASGELGPGAGEAGELRRVDKVLALRDAGAVGKLEASLEAFEANMPERWKGQMRMVGKQELEEPGDDDNLDGEGPTCKLTRTANRLKKYKLRNVAGGAIGKGGALWPYRLITRAWAHLLSQHPDRLRIETWTPVTSVDVATSSSADATQQHPYLLTTPRGPIAAAEVVYCTNGHTGHLLPRLRQRQRPDGGPGGAALFPLRGTMTVQDCGPSFPDEGARRTLSFYGSVKVVVPPPPPPPPNKNSSSSSSNNDDNNNDDDDPVFDLGLHYMQQNAATGAVFIGGESATAADMLNADDSRASATSLARLGGVLRAEFKDEVWSEEEVKEEEDGKKGQQRRRRQPEVTSSWSGIMGFTADGVPLVGRLPEAATGRRGGGGGGGGKGGEWIAAGFNGYGMGNCWLSGEALAGMMRGEDVSGRLPECYLATEERLASFQSRKAAERLFGC